MPSAYSIQDSSVYQITRMCRFSLVPRLHPQTERKAGGEPGTTWHVTDVKFHQGGTFDIDAVNRSTNIDHVKPRTTGGYKTRTICPARQLHDAVKTGGKPVIR